MLIILIVGIVVVGPKKLPGMMRTAGRWVAKARRMTTEVRAQSGIDRLIREEGLENEIRELSSLTRSNMLSNLALNPLASTEREVTAFAKRPLLASSTATSTATSAGTSTAAASPTESSTPKVSELGAPATGDSEASSAPAPSQAALNLIKPPSGSMPRKGGHDEALRALVASGLFSIREREYPTIGCDSYDCLPDDIDDPEAYAEDGPEEPVLTPPVVMEKSAPIEAKESA